MTIETLKAPMLCCKVTSVQKPNNVKENCSEQLYKAIISLHSSESVGDTINSQRLIQRVQNILINHPQVLSKKVQILFFDKHNETSDEIKKILSADLNDLFEYSLPLHWISCLGMTKLIQMFLHHYPQSIRIPIEAGGVKTLYNKKPTNFSTQGIKFGRFNRYPLYLAVKHGQLHAAKELFQAYPDLIQVKDEYWNNLFHIAACHGHSDMMTFLLEHYPLGAYKENLSGSIPLHLSCFYGHLKISQLLVERYPCCLLHFRDKSAALPLHSSVAGRKSCELTRYLIDAYPETLAIPDCYGLPLHSAIQSQNFKFVQLVFEKTLEYDVFDRDNIGGLFSSPTATAIAATTDSTNITTILPRNIAWNQIKREFGTKQAFSLLKLAHSKEGAPVLQAAIGKVCLFDLQLFIEKLNIDLTCRDNKGSTPLDVLLTRTHINGADWNDEYLAGTFALTLGNTCTANTVKMDRLSPAMILNGKERLPLHEAIERHLPYNILMDIISANYDALGHIDPMTNLFPFMMVGQGQLGSLHSVYEMLRQMPDIMGLMAGISYRTHEY